MGSMRESGYYFLKHKHETEYRNQLPTFDILQFQHSSEAFSSYLYIWFGFLCEFLWEFAKQWSREKFAIGHLHDDVIVLLRPESFRTLLSCANQGFCYRNLTEITKLKYERKNEKDSGRSSKMTSSCKQPILSHKSRSRVRILIYRKWAIRF